MQPDLGEFSSVTKLQTFSKDEIISRYTDLEAEYLKTVRELYKLKNQKLTDEQLGFLLKEQLIDLRADMFGASSERYKKPDKPTHKPKEPGTPPAPRPKLPSERYPNIPIREQVITQSPAPTCTQCGSLMVDSGLTEDSEQLTVIPKKYEIIKVKRIKYRCQCQGCMIAAAAPERIIPGSSYSDEMILDVAVSKYCDLIPVQRYVSMAARSGIMDLPPQSLIELTHGLADFLEPVYNRIKEEILSSRVLHADETPHHMLEGPDKKSWYLWGFSTPMACYLDCRNTRSGDVASELLIDSQCEVLVSDVFSGYNKAIRVSNEARHKAGRPSIINANCNAHARRYFFKCKDHYEESHFYLDQYHEIYQLNAQARGQPPDQVKKLREQMIPLFEKMKLRAQSETDRYPRENRFRKALNYFLENYIGLTVFLKDPDVAIDNNLQERLLRNHVIGRKTWYGTHSLRGAQTAATLFSIIESCKLLHINPREYLEVTVKTLLANGQPFTPAEFVNSKP
jgi:transposase